MDVIILTASFEKEKKKKKKALAFFIIIFLNYCMVAKALHAVCRLKEKMSVVFLRISDKGTLKRKRLGQI